MVASKSIQNDRIIIFITHFIDEAEHRAPWDRNEIRTDIKMVCYGFGFLFKNQYGLGYYFTFYGGEFKF